MFRKTVSDTLYWPWPGRSAWYDYSVMGIIAKFRALSDFQRIVLMNTLNGIGMGLVGIFIPIYLLGLDFSFFTVVLWLLIHHLTLLCGAFLTAAIARKIGLVRCWYIRTALVALLFSGLVFLPQNHALIFALAMVSGLESAFFWIPFNIFTVRKTEERTMGASLAFMQNASSFVGILIPGIAALLIVSYGYGVLFALAALFILLSLVPVLALHGESVSFEFSFPAIKKIVLDNKYFILPEILDNLGQDAQVIWSLFIFITGLSILDIGALGVLVGIVGMAVTHFTGQLIDRWNVRSLMRLGAVATTLLWFASYIVAIYSPTQFLLYLVTVLRGLALGVFASSYGTIMLNRARGADIQFLLLREIPTIFGRVFVFVATLGLIATGHAELTFLLVALLSVYFWFNNIEKLTSQ